MNKSKQQTLLAALAEGAVSQQDLIRQLGATIPELRWMVVEGLIVRDGVDYYSTPQGAQELRRINRRLGHLRPQLPREVA